MISADEDLAEAWRRVLTDRALPGDGMRVILWLRARRMQLTPIGLPTCAVHDHEGQRRLAAEILTFAESAEHDPDNASDASADLALQRARRRDGAGTGEPRARGAARRVPER